jgi:hypothetical protein
MAKVCPCLIDQHSPRRAGSIVKLSPVVQDTHHHRLSSSMLARKETPALLGRRFALMVTNGPDLIRPSPRRIEYQSPPRRAHRFRRSTTTQTVIEVTAPEEGALQLRIAKQSVSASSATSIWHNRSCLDFDKKKMMRIDLRALFRLGATDTSDAVRI